MELEKTMAQLGKERRLSNGNLGKMAGTSGAVIGRYERGEITPSVEIANKIAIALGVSLDYLVGNTGAVIKDKKLLQRIQEIANLSEDRKKYIFDFIDMALRDYKTQKAYSS
ncbi:helix-turn-helix domain-containing protein [Ulvibacterium marinum]|uniref:helix-turn-helix domain-containing protein n=1 Tax=Ulvibacterium marinum TaxID=2419782 RepID=UPI0024959DE5|nr:helix-turn-helix transcriptional regulator [Ulvibacterium marinum]